MVGQPGAVQSERDPHGHADAGLRARRRVGGGDDEQPALAGGAVGGEGEPPAVVGVGGVGVRGVGQLPDREVVAGPARRRPAVGVEPEQAVRCLPVQAGPPAVARERDRPVPTGQGPVVDARELDGVVGQPLAADGTRGGVEEGAGQLPDSPGRGGTGGCETGRDDPLDVVQDDRVAGRGVVELVGVGGVPGPEGVVGTPADRAAVAGDQRDAGAPVGLSRQQSPAGESLAEVEEERCDHQHEVVLGQGQRSGRRGRETSAISRGFGKGQPRWRATVVASSTRDRRFSLRRLCEMWVWTVRGER